MTMLAGNWPRDLLYLNLECYLLATESTEHIDESQAI